MPLKSRALFYHVWSPADTDVWRLLVDEQLKRIVRSGLHRNADIFCSIAGPQYMAIEQAVRSYEWVTVIGSTGNEANYEGETLAHLHAACVERPDLEYVGYVHTKGIQHFPAGTPETMRAVNTWRHFLEWGTIDRWRDATVFMQTSDVVGVNYRASPWPHFSGNFWWATAKHIRTLPAPTMAKLAIDRDPGTYSIVEERLSYEKWVCSNNPKPFSFFDFPFSIPGRDWTFGFDLYKDDIYPFYENNTG